MKRFLPFFGLLAFVGCASNNNIFPSPPDVSAVALSSPLSVVPDPARDQILIINSNVDYLYSQGSITTVEVSVDKTDPDHPIVGLTPTSVTSTPNFAGEQAFDGNSLTLSFRENVAGTDDTDQIKTYSVSDGSLSETKSGTTLKGPFGLAAFGTDFLVVTDNFLQIFDSNLVAQTNIDLKAAAEHGFIDASSTHVENVAVDTVNNKAFITNRLGKIFVVDLDGDKLTLTHVIAGPKDTRGIAFDGTYFYVVDGTPPTLWVMDASSLTDSATRPAEVDDSKLVIQNIDLGVNPNGIAIDTTNNKAYVVNSTDRTLSVIDTQLLEEIDRLSLKEEDTGLAEAKDPFGVSVGTFNGIPLVFVSNFTSNTITVINGTNLEVLASYP